MNKLVIFIVFCCFASSLVLARPTNDEADKGKSAIEWLKKDELFNDESLLKDEGEASSDNEETKEGDCIICYEDFSQTKGVELKCSHIYHEKCLVRWHNEQPILGLDCPLCHKTIELNSGESFKQMFDRVENEQNLSLRLAWGLLGGLSQFEFKPERRINLDIYREGL